MIQNIINRVLQEETLRNILKILSIVLSIILAYGIGRVGGLFVSATILNLPLPPVLLPPQIHEDATLNDVGFSQIYFKGILDQNIFDAATSPKEENPQKTLTQPKVDLANPSQVNDQQIGFLLYGTMILTNYSYAWLGRDSPNTALTFRINDCFSPALELAKECTGDNMQLTKIAKRRVAILWNQQEIWLELTEQEPLETLASVTSKTKQNTAKAIVAPEISTPKPQPKVSSKPKPSTPQPSANSQQEIFQIQRVWVDEQLANFGQILQDASVIPEIKGEKTLFKFEWIKEDSMYARLGLKEGDIILTINDIVIDSISKAMGLLNKLQSERQIALEVERDGKLKVLQYFIN